MRPVMHDNKMGEIIPYTLNNVANMALMGDPIPMDCVKQNGPFNGIFHGGVDILGIGAHEVEVGLGNEFLEVSIGEGGSAMDVGFNTKVSPFLMPWLVLVVADC